VIRIVLGEHLRLVRQAIRCLLEQENDMEVIGELADGLKVVPTIGRLKPGVLVVALGLPGLNYLEVTRQVRRQTPGTKIVVLSPSLREEHVRAAMRNGASAYVVKQAKANDLVRAIRRVMAGRRYLSPPFSERSVDAWLRARGASDPYDSLTEREREVLQLVAEGDSSNRIAARLSISPRTAETHRASAMRKLGLTRPFELIRFAVARGFLVLPRDPV
jgi:two-component system, NarL family, response regulator NreC